MPATNTATLTPILIDRAGLKALGVTLSNAWLLRLEAEGRFPRRLSLGARSTQWLLSEVRDFIAQRAADRDESAAERRRVTRPGTTAANQQRATPAKAA